MAKNISNPFLSYFFPDKYSKVRKICFAKGPKKRPGSTKNELDKMPIKLNRMKLYLGVIMQKIF